MMEAATGMDNAIQQVTLTPEEGDRSRALLYTLSMLTRSEALLKVKTVRDQCGPEAWRQLTLRW